MTQLHPLSAGALPPKLWVSNNPSTSSTSTSTTTTTATPTATATPTTSPTSAPNPTSALNPTSAPNPTKTPNPTHTPNPTTMTGFNFVVPYPNITEPSYGGVPDICNRLGYPLTPVADRKGSTLGQATAEYRKRVNARDPDRPRCPLDANDPEALSYARGFLEENKSRFEPSEAAQQHGWPMYPRDEQLIVTLLAKLICTQECYWRRNQNYFQKRDAERDYEASRQAKNPKDPSSQAARPARSTPSASPRMTDEDREMITANINDHLQFAYPLSGGKMDTNWLFKPLKMDKGFIDPYKVDPFAMRYLHERSLYNTRDPARIDQFVEDTIKYYLLARENKEWEYRIRHRCENVIKEFAKSWKAWEKGGFGFLESVVGHLQKTPEFENKWTDRRLLWLNQVYQGKSTSIIEWNSNPEILHDGSGRTVSSSSKRGSDLSNNTPGSKHADKRVRLGEQNSSNGQSKTRSPLEKTQLNPKETITLSDSSSSDDRPRRAFKPHPRTAPGEDAFRIIVDRLHGKQSEGRKAIRTPSSNSRASLLANTSKISLGGSRSATASPLDSSAPFPSRRSVSGQSAFIPLTKPAPIGNSPAYHGHPQAAVNPILKNIAQQTGPSTPQAAGNPILKNITQQTGPSTTQAAVNPILKTITQQTGPSTPQASQPKRLSINGIPNSFASTPARSTPNTGRKSTAALKFAIQDETGVPDDEPSSLLSKKQIYELSIDGLFRTVANKSGVPEASLYQLTFRCQWEPASFIVTKHAGEEPWKRQKKKLNSLFVGAQAEFPEDDEFEVWVLCGDRVTKKKSMKEEDVDDEDDDE